MYIIFYIPNYDNVYNKKKHLYFAHTIPNWRKYEVFNCNKKSFIGIYFRGISVVFPAGLDGVMKEQAGFSQSKPQ